MNKVRYYREYYGISKIKLARLAKISHVEIGYIESEERIPNVFIAIRIARVLNVPVEKLFIE